MSKSLTEQINEVKNMKASTAAKYSNLIKLGLRPVEVSELINAWRQEEREGRLAAAMRYTFGVELEVIGVTSPARMVAEASARGLSAAYEHYNHTDNSRYFKFVSDGSIVGDGGIECVSPILNAGAEGDRAIKAICQALQAAGARVNRSTGLHVHVGGEITDSQYCNVFANYQALQADISLHLATSRRNNFYCNPLAGFDGLRRCGTPADVLRCIGTRYASVNPDAWSRHRTIEFRQHQGTVNAKKVEMWAKFCIKLVAWSKDHRLEGPATIADAKFLTAAEKRWWAGRKAELAPAVAEMAF